MANRASALFAQACARGSKVAIHFGAQAITYADLAQRVRAAAGGLAKLGVARGSHVGLLLPAGPDFIVIQQALFALGAVVTPINALYRAGEVAHAAQCCALSFIVTDAAHGESCAQATCPLISIDAGGDTGGPLALAPAIAHSAPLATLVEIDEHDLRPALHLRHHRQGQGRDPHRRQSRRQLRSHPGMARPGWRYGDPLRAAAV